MLSPVVVFSEKMLTTMATKNMKANLPVLTPLRLLRILSDVMAEIVPRMGLTSHTTTGNGAQGGRKKANILYGRPSEKGLLRHVAYFPPLPSFGKSVRRPKKIICTTG